MTEFPVLDHAMMSEALRLTRVVTVCVTLEPCGHHGRTPRCTDALIGAGVARVVCAMRDPYPRVAGDGMLGLKAAGCERVVLASDGPAGWRSTRC